MEGRTRVNYQRFTFVGTLCASFVTRDPRWVIAGFLSVCLWLWLVRDDDDITEVFEADEQAEDY